MDDTRIAALETENEHLRALLAATQKALIIEPGKTYVVEIPDDIATADYEQLADVWRGATNSKVVILTGGAHVARERVESE